jgi:hypothetical protein
MGSRTSILKLLHVPQSGRASRFDLHMHLKVRVHVGVENEKGSTTWQLYVLCPSQPDPSGFVHDEMHVRLAIRGCATPAPTSSHQNSRVGWIQSGKCKAEASAFPTPLERGIPTFLSLTTLLCKRTPEKGSKIANSSDFS